MAHAKQLAGETPIRPTSKVPATVSQGAARTESKDQHPIEIYVMIEEQPSPAELVIGALVPEADKPETRIPRATAQSKVRISIGHHEHDATVDTGAVISVSSNSFMEKFGLKKKEWPPEERRVTITGVTGDRMDIGDYYADFTFWIQGQPFRHSFHVSMNGPDLFILGNDFFDGKDIIYCWKDKKVTMMSDWISQKPVCSPTTVVVQFSNFRQILRGGHHSRKGGETIRLATRNRLPRPNRSRRGMV